MVPRRKMLYHAAMGLLARRYRWSSQRQANLLNNIVHYVNINDGSCMPIEIWLGCRPTVPRYCRQRRRRCKSILQIHRAWRSAQINVPVHVLCLQNNMPRQARRLLVRTGRPVLRQQLVHSRIQNELPKLVQHMSSNDVNLVHQLQQFHLYFHLYVNFHLHVHCDINNSYYNYGDSTTRSMQRPNRPTIVFRNRWRG